MKTKETEQLEHDIRAATRKTPAAEGVKIWENMYSGQKMDFAQSVKHLAGFGT